MCRSLVSVSVATAVCAVAALAISIVVGGPKVTLIIAIVLGQWTFGLALLVCLWAILWCVNRSVKLERDRRGFEPLWPTRNTRSPAISSNAGSTNERVLLWKFVGAMTPFIFLLVFAGLIAKLGYTGEYCRELQVEFWYWRLQKVDPRVASDSMAADKLRELLASPDAECREDVASKLAELQIPTKKSISK